MRHLILVLIHVPPEADVHLPLCEDRFRQDPPLMTTHCSIIQVLILLQDLDEVPNGGFGSCLKQPEGQVVVAAGQGPVNCRQFDYRHEMTTLGEPLVVFVEGLQSFSAGVLDADANSRPGPIEPFDLEALQDPIMHMGLIGRGGAPRRLLAATKTSLGSNCLGSGNRHIVARVSSTLWASFFAFPTSTRSPFKLGVPNLLCEFTILALEGHKVPNGHRWLEM